MIAIVLAWGNSLSSAQTIAPMVTNFDYSNYTFQYTEGGETKTANLTDEATTPDHIIALLKAVYTDKTIPGIHYGYNYGTPDNNSKLDYAQHASQGTPWTLGTADATNYPNPDQDGMTLLLVQFKEDWTSKTPGGNWSAWTYIDHAYSSVKLITNFTRVHNANNPGYLFSIDGAANRFFFISKGKTRNTPTRPLYRLFEQISPVNTHTGSLPTTNFINDMRNGNSYLCYHDCGDVGTIDNGHWFTISQSGEAFSLNNLTIFIPDRRLEDNRGNNQNQANNPDFYCFYGGQAYNHTAVMPKVLMYTASLEATATPSETNGYYQVNLKWDTSFTPEKLGVDVPQHYYVYILNEDNTRTLIEDVAKDPVNNLVVTKHHDYPIQQTTDPQTIKYVIEAQTINYDNDGNIIYKDGKPLITLQAESPVRSITIPGYNPFFTQVSEYRSRYDVTNEVNIYKNKLSIRPTSAEDFVALKNNQEEYNVTRTDANGDKVTIATVQFTQQEGQEGYNYTVNYNAETQVTEEGLVFDNEVPTTNGIINDFAGSTVFVIDRFTASTKTNEQSNKYTYKFEQNEGLYSNTQDVPVYKTTNAVNGVGYTNAEIITTDTNHSLRAAPCNKITFHAINDPSANLSDYYVYRLDDNGNYAVGKAEQPQNNGVYDVYVVGTDGHLNVQTGIQHFTQEGGDITVTDQNQSVADEESRYVPVITTHYGGDQNKPNTYGCDIKSVSYPQVELAVKDMMKTNPFAGSTGPMLGYLVKLGITPKLPRKSDINYVYYYRLWRVVENQEGAPTQFSNEILLNLEVNNSGQDDHGQTLWASDYDCLHDFYPGNDNKQVDDIFLDWVFNGKKEVKYIVRLYATYIHGDNPGEGGDPGFEDDFDDFGPGDDIDQIPAPSPAPAIATPKANDGKDYFIAEDIIIITFNNGTPTAVGTINVEAQPVSVTYYNMLGVGSSRPHPGVNVMVTRYNDGTTSTTKVIR